MIFKAFNRHSKQLQTPNIEPKTTKINELEGNLLRKCRALQEIILMRKQKKAYDRFDDVSLRRQKFV